jgi:hypothetical protein
MAALPTNDQILDRYFQSDNDKSDFEGFSEVGSDVDIPNALDSSEDEQGDDDSESENDEEIWTDRFRDVKVHDFTERTGPVFPDGFNVETASPKNYFDLMFNPDMTGNIVRNTNNYVRWKMDQKGICQRRCRIHLNNKVRKETVYGCKTCDVHLCKDGCHFTYHREQND